MRKISLKSVSPGSPVKISTNPFFLETLVFLCLSFAMDMVGKEKNIDIITEKTESGARIRFAHLNIPPEPGFPTEKEKDLLAFLKTEITLGTSELILDLV
ncbi:MAG: hypothetical protein GY795_29565 [Desulfobacterales bacterium]|nr:hypothetical protein [Desulfobacterales bacterium]